MCSYSILTKTEERFMDTTARPRDVPKATEVGRADRGSTPATWLRAFALHPTRLLQSQFKSMNSRENIFK